MENRDHDISDLGLRHQGDAEEGTHHPWDEVGLVVAWIYTDQHRLGHTVLADLIKNLNVRGLSDAPNFCHMLKSS